MIYTKARTHVYYMVDKMHFTKMPSSSEGLFVLGLVPV